MLIGGEYPKFAWWDCEKLRDCSAIVLHTSGPNFDAGLLELEIGMLTTSYLSTVTSLFR